MPSQLNIAVVEPDRERALTIVDGLRDSGDFEITVIADVTSLARRLGALSPDVMLIDLIKAKGMSEKEAQYGLRQKGADTYCCPPCG